VRDLGILLDEELTMNQHQHQQDDLRCIFTISDSWGKCNPFSELRSLPASCQPSFWADWITAMRCWPIYQPPPSHHYSVLRMWQPDLSKIYVH